MGDDQRQPLLQAARSAQFFTEVHSNPSVENDNEFSEWARYEYVNKSQRRLGAVEAGAAINGDEIRAAASADPYPIWIYGALVTPEEPVNNNTGKLEHYRGLGDQPLEQSDLSSAQVLQEEEIRELLLDYVGRHCCWGRSPARTWRIVKVEDCNSYIGTLETFIEERDVIDDVEPYGGGAVDGKDGGRILGAWEVDMRGEFPLLFVSRKEARTKLPHSEVVEKCQDCSGGVRPCLKCNPNPEPGHHVAGRMSRCPVCLGRGLKAHLDGSDTICEKCRGEGKLPCSDCGSRGLVKCEKCRGEGALLYRKILVVRWRTILHKRVSATKNAASVPDDVFHEAAGVQLYQHQSHQCEPAYFPESPGLTKFSESVIAERVLIPPAARVICERHQISLVPVTRVVMGKGKKSFTFYIIGVKRDVYLKGYPANKCCGFCCGGCCIS
ncbi:hypothetical protein KP509_12G003400 [Ceratopteris richardii]|uniref:Protein SSUH2 homolog n=1 Tax=Ceratopteris richardii TaxID=49495 RepID=A0A8T2TIK5_CERRI|nr:hypothetical protein KP509_12G003400 [Ceratopteris richardii]